MICLYVPVSSLSLNKFDPTSPGLGLKLSLIFYLNFHDRYLVIFFLWSCLIPSTSYNYTSRKIFESVLETWCMLPGGSEMPKEVQDFVSDAFSVLFEAPPMPKEKSFKNRDHIDLSVDHQLSKLYRQAMQEVQAIVGQVDY